MESPVRICLGAALVVNLLLLSNTTVYGNAIPRDATIIGDEPRQLPARSRPETPDVSLNELNSKIKPKVSTSEENAKYKDRGRGNVKFQSQLKMSTENSRRRVRATEPPKLLVVTDTQVDSRRLSKVPSLTSSTTPMTVEKNEQSEEEYDDGEDEEEEEEEQDSSEKLTSSLDNFFSMTSFDGFTHDSEFDSSNKKVKHDFDSASYGGFSSLFPSKATYGFTEPTHDSFKSEFFNYETDLTTPKNDYFDKKFRQVSRSIKKNLDTMKAKATSPNATNIQKIIKENLNTEQLGNNSIPGNKSTVFIKNTKEIRLLDNDGAGSTNKELSDVQGTSIYYEMSVLSTETYAINNSDYDCDNDTTSSGPTPSTSVEEELISINAVPQSLPTTTKLPDPGPEASSTVSSSYSPVSTASTINPITSSTKKSVSSVENTKTYLHNFRSRSYSKRLNFNGNKDSPNSVTSKPVLSSSASPRLTPKFQLPKLKTTPKSKRVWMWPRRNSTIVSPIYSEHFSTKANTTTRPRLSSPFFVKPVKTALTTVSSEIDPVLQDDISGPKKVVHSQSISDNTVPSLSKRGSTKFGVSTALSKEVDAESEMPPTAWALATLRITPPSPVAINKTGSLNKSIDENELQSANELLEKTRATTTVSTTTTLPNPISNDIIPKRIKDVLQNKPLAQATTTPTNAETQSKNNTTSEIFSNVTNLSAENSVEESGSTEVVTESYKYFKESWVPIGEEDDTTDKNEIEKETNQHVDLAKPSRFESITKLPAEITTPQDENVASSEVNQTIADAKPTTNYEITTIRFSYIPTEDAVTTPESETDPTEPIIPSTWHPVFPTRTRITTLEDTPVTTYRPKYTATEEKEDETTTVFIETSSPIEVSSQVLENLTKMSLQNTELPTKTSSESTSIPTTTEITTETVTEENTSQPTIVETSTEPVTTERTSTTTEATTTEATTTEATTTEVTTTEVTTTEVLPTTITSETVEDTTTTVVEVVTEINTEKEHTIVQTVPSIPTQSSAKNQQMTDSPDGNSSSNEVTPGTIKTTSAASPAGYLTTTPVHKSTYSVKTEVPTTTEVVDEMTTQRSAKIQDTTMAVTASNTEYTTKATNEDTTIYTGDMTTEASSRVFESEDSGSGAAIAIAVSTIGVVALILLIGLLLVVRRRGRRGVYAQRCTPVSLDAYSLDSVSVGHRKGNHRLRASKRSYGNPAYDDEVTSHPMQYAALASFALDVESMTAEFAEIPSLTVRPEEVPPGCEDKNRYSNVLPLPETRVPLKRLGNDPTTEYINANYITGPGNIRNYYIACQAPLSNTVVDFWRMIWEQNSRLVVMLTEYMENGVEKCYEYLPPSEISDNKRIFGDFKIILKKREQRDKYAVSSVQLINLSTRTWREITHLWYFWPAKGVPDDYDSVIDFLCEMRSYMKISQAAKEYDEEGVEVIYGDQNRTSFSNLSKLRSDDSGSGNGVNIYSPAKAEEQMRRVMHNNGTLGRMKAASDVEGIRPCVVVCASGAGRSAALVALDVCARALPGAADVPRVVRHLRAQRPHSLSNRHHYIFVYKVLSEYGNKMLGGGVDTI
ncbi:unnamed protein product [Arctia plantaginis]|uniref:Uncharacterized protein n=1 Tax=Arctia plantaginis TaxID=874455 RepID=A0A8S1AF95_ARCPL|nr:unnamed protein product [Arctia plantaginis]CAB3260486.1 unnamed protein product [Arctia plantaginis]